MRGFAGGRRRRRRFYRERWRHRFDDGREILLTGGRARLDFGETFFQFGAQRGRRLRAPGRILLDHVADDGAESERQVLQFLERRRLVQVLAHDLRERTTKRHLPGEHVPKRHP